MQIRDDGTQDDQYREQWDGMQKRDIGEFAPTTRGTMGEEEHKDGKEGTYAEPSTPQSCPDKVVVFPPPSRDVARVRQGEDV